MTKAEERILNIVNLFKENKKVIIESDEFINDIKQLLDMIENLRIYKNNCKHRFNSGRWCEMDTQLLFDELDKMLGVDENAN